MSDFKIKSSFLLCLCLLAVVGCSEKSKNKELVMDQVSEETYTNQLVNETSPYLLQHAHNPVNWRPWGDEALQVAKDEDKPIFLSIGYSACHWCHVMEHESFENEKIAALINRDFIAIKVDREERPDLDAIYMDAVQMMTGSGGWPLSVFLTPDLKPFYGGTYFPPTDMQGRPGFGTVLTQISSAWKTRRKEIEHSADSLTQAVRVSAKGNDSDDTVVATVELTKKAVDQWKQSFDPKWGGFGSAPKFPSTGAIAVLLREYNRSGDDSVANIIKVSLDRMAYGGMYDQLGGGFHRYSVDKEWLVPHFEKMLYDNALLSSVYLEAYQLLGDPQYRRVAVDIFDYVIREMSDKAGGFHSTEDADSEGEEGVFYVWNKAEIIELLGGQEAALFNSYYGVTDRGNFEGKNILNVIIPLDEFAKKQKIALSELSRRLAASRAILLKERDGRVHPAKDDKVLASWNGMMISSLARGYQVLGDERFLVAAERAADFIISDMMSDGELLHTYRAGQAKVGGFLDDYAQAIAAMLDMYESTFDVKWINSALLLSDKMIELFSDDKAGGFYLSSVRHKHLLARTKPVRDSSVPSGNAVAALSLFRLSELTGRMEYRAVAYKTVAVSLGLQSKYPSSFAYMLLARGFVESDPFEIAVIGSRESVDTVELLANIRGGFMPYKVVSLLDPGQSQKNEVTLLPLLANRNMVDGKATVYLCRNFTCKKPVTDVEELGSLLGNMEKR